MTTSMGIRFNMNMYCTYDRWTDRLTLFITSCVYYELHIQNTSFSSTLRETNTCLLHTPDELSSRILLYRNKKFKKFYES